MDSKDSKKNNILQIIYESIDEHNMLNPLEYQMSKSLNTSIMGKNSVLDSLGLLSFLVDLESKIKEELVLNSNLINEELIAENSGHYENVESILNYILLISE
tara:strand:+ start:82 stop:387 length:306 start_codon:yes stop_codon:yes gene_type:complete